MRLLIIPVLFLLMPLAEIAGFVVVGREFGVGTTLLLVLLSAVAGAVLLRIQGLGVLKRIQQSTQSGSDPGRELVHGVMIVVAAFLLILPGFISDILGLLLFIPFVRDWGWKLVKNRLTIVTSRAGGFTRAPSAPGSSTRRQDAKVIDLSEDEFTHQDGKPSKGFDDRDRLR